MSNDTISKNDLRCYLVLYKIADIKRYFKRFTKKGRAQLAYEKMRFDQIRERILNYKDDTKMQNRDNQAIWLSLFYFF